MEILETLQKLAGLEPTVADHIDALCERTDADLDPTRREIAQNLSLMCRRDDPGAREALDDLYRLLDQTDPTVRRHIANALYGVAKNHPGAFDDLDRVMIRMRADQDADTNHELLRVLAAVAPETPGEVALKLSPAVETATSLPTETDLTDPRLIILDLFTTLVDANPNAVERHTDLVRQYAAADQPLGVQATAFEAVCELHELIDDPSYIDPQLADALHADDPALRTAAFEALEYLACHTHVPLPRAMGELEHLPFEDDHALRETAALTITRITLERPDRMHSPAEAAEGIRESFNIEKFCDDEEDVEKALAVLDGIAESAES